MTIYQTLFHSIIFKLNLEKYWCILINELNFNSPIGEYLEENVEIQINLCLGLWK